MHGSGNVVFVAPVDVAVLDAVESTLIWVYRSSLLYNRVGRHVAPEPLSLRSSTSEKSRSSMAELTWFRAHLLVRER